MTGMRIAVIPARGGSKRIPRKNVKDFCGKPMIAWSINVAQKSGLFDRVVVSTDDNDIADIARQWGAEVPFVRPAELSDDHAGTTPVIAHSTQWALDQGFDVAAVCCIYATAPFIQADDIAKGWDALNAGTWDYTFAATDFASPIFRSFEQMPGGGLQMFFPESFTKRSQDLPRALHDAGQFYWGRPNAWLTSKRVFDRTSLPILIPRWRVQDIDTEDDWLRAELMHQAMTFVPCKNT
jgi:pseudaminic acid cytidylyltransferase